MKNNEYIDYRDKYFIVDNTFKEINVSDFYDYVYIIIRETKNYFFNDKIVLYDSEVPITLVGNTPIEMTHFMSNNEYTFTFSSNKNLQFVYSSKLQSQKFLTVEYDGNYAVKGKIDNKDFIINLENKDLSEKVLNIRVSNYDENSETPDFSIIVYEKEPIPRVYLEKNDALEDDIFAVLLHIKYAEYDKSGKPLEMSKMQAEDIALGLNLNFITAFPITVKWEIRIQPYYYNKGHFEWVDDET
jgi:hypothetical protein